MSKLTWKPSPGVESIAMISRQNLVAVEQMSAAAKALAGESEGLQQRVQAFQV